MKKMIAVLCVLLFLGLAACGVDREITSVNSAEVAESSTNSETVKNETETDDTIAADSLGTLTEGTEYYQGFLIDNVLHSASEGDIHYNVYFPESYDGSEPYALYVTLPGYEGLYFQGAASNLESEDFGFEALQYNEQMIVLAPQLEDWQETSANKTIALVEYFLARYNIDTSRVYASGYSGGGETMSLVLSVRPDLFTAYLHVSSQWDGTFDAVAEAHLPVYFVVGRDDEYYGSEPTVSAYNSLHELYEQQGLSEEEIDELLVLDIKENEYFTEQGAPNEHGGGAYIAYDEEIMGWLFSKVSDTEKTTVSNENINHFPDELEEIPEDYFTSASLQGELVDLYYETWESITYEQESQTLTKHAVVYLPYGYSEDTQYPVFYLMHGGWSDENGYLGTPDQPNELKNILDHGIEDGVIEPMIVVCPTYNNTSGEDSASYSLALTLTDNYHNELINDLIPAVEGTYSTYAEDTTLEGLAASRDYRAFCGFSMGSVATWRTFQYCLDYFRYFMPSSGSLTTDGEAVADMVRNSGYDWDDFFIFAASGTNDFAYSAFKAQIDAMAAVEDGTFRYADNEEDGNLFFLEKEGGIHSGEYALLYIYNGLRWIWR